MLLDTTSDRTFLAATAGPRRLVRHPALAALTLLYVAAVVALLLTLRLLGDRTWVGTLFLLLPRWPWLLPLAMLLPWSVWRRAWTCLILLAATGATVLVPIMGFRLAMPPRDDARGELRILCCNVHREQARPADLLRLIAEVKPDVVALQDWSSVNDAIFAEGEWNVRREGELLVATRYPIGRVTVLPLAEIGSGPKAERGAAASFELMTERGPIHLVNVHLASPHTGLLTFRDDNGALLRNNLERRWDQSAAVRALVDSLSGPVLLAGDFNTTDDSPIMAEHWSDFADAFHRKGWGLGLTYLNRTTQIRIDHILLDRRIHPVRFWLAESVGSPHRPLIADLRFDEDAWPIGTAASENAAERASAGEADLPDGR